MATQAKSKSKVKAPGAGGGRAALTERHCPHCHELHASSLIPARELSVYASGERLAMLQDAGTEQYRVFICEGRQYVIAHEEEGA